METLGEAEVAEWQTRQVQDLVHAKVGVGSSPTFGTIHYGLEVRFRRP